MPKKARKVYPKAQESNHLNPQDQEGLSKKRPIGYWYLLDQEYRRIRTPNGRRNYVTATAFFRPMAAACRLAKAWINEHGCEGNVILETEIRSHLTLASRTLKFLSNDQEKPQESTSTTFIHPPVALMEGKLDLLKLLNAVDLPQTPNHATLPALCPQDWVNHVFVFHLEASMIPSEALMALTDLPSTTATPPHYHARLTLRSVETYVKPSRTAYSMAAARDMVSHPSRTPSLITCENTRHLYPSDDEEFQEDGDTARLGEESEGRDHHIAS